MRHHLIKSSIVAAVLILLLTGSNCGKDTPPIVPPEDGPDTTSHDFTFTEYTFGGTGGSSYFKDVAVVNDSNIWAVGAVYLSSDTFFNAIHWDGKTWDHWELYYNDHSIINSIRGMWIINEQEIFLAAGSIFRWNGSSNQVSLIFSRLDLSDPNGTIEKLWGVKNNLYGVGNGGTIVRFDGSTWSKQESGTTIDLRDVWGTPDGKTVWACGWSNDNGQSILLKYDGSDWQTIWNRNGSSSVPPFGYFVTSAWNDQSTYLSVGRGVFRISGYDTVQTTILPWFPYRIRGSAENNIAVAGDEGMIWHYNGASWMEISSKSIHSYYSLAASKNVIVAVGTDNSIGWGAGLVMVGKRIQ